jgi:histone H3/H4
MNTGTVAAAAAPSTTGGSTFPSGGPQQPPNKQQQLSATSSSKTTSGIGQNALSQSQQSNPAVVAAQLNQIKIERGRIARRELMELDAIERAFRDDMTVWAGPTKVIPPHSLFSRGENNITRGWMYGGGYAGIGGRTWMEATSTSSSSYSPPPAAAAAVNDGGSSSSSSSTFLLDDVKIVDKSLHANGLSRHDVTPKAYACFLEQARRFGLELLANARDYAIHAKRSSNNNNGGMMIQPSDLHLAAEMSEDGGGGGIHGVPSTLPNMEQISDLAQSINRVPLPAIPTNCYDGVVLPPVTEQLTARTYDVVDGARVAQRMMRGGDAPLVSEYGPVPVTAKKKSTVGGSYGATRGRQIAVVIKGKDAAAAVTDAAGGGGAMVTTSATTSTTSAATNLGSSASTSTTKPVIKKGQKRGLTEL